MLLWRKEPRDRVKPMFRATNTHQRIWAIDEDNYGNRQDEERDFLLPIKIRLDYYIQQ